MFVVHQRCIAYALALGFSLSLAACGGDSGDGSSPTDTAGNTETPAFTIPSAPVDPAYVDSAPVDTSVKAFVDYYYTVRDRNACYATVETNAGIRLVKGFLDLWTPVTPYADANLSSSLSASFDPDTGEACPEVPANAWNLMATTGGTIKAPEVLAANVQYAVDATKNRTAEQTKQASVDHVMNKTYLMAEGMGRMTQAWRSAMGMTLSYSYDTSSGTRSSGRGGSSSSSLGKVYTLDSDGIQYGNNDVTKYYFKYQRPYMWNNQAVMAPSVNETSPGTSTGFVSGHTMGGWREAGTLAYAMPERFQEFYARAMKHGETRVWSGAHTPLDTIGGRMSGLASAAANLYSEENSDIATKYKNATITASLKHAAREQALSVMQAAAGTSDWKSFYDYLHSGQAEHSSDSDYDEFADHEATKADFDRRMTLGMTKFSNFYTTDLAPVVPKGAEVLLETRYPYLSAEQRRVVLKTTEFSSGYPVMTDAEGWGRLNMFAAGDGYGAFNGLVSINMDASLGNFATYDIWRNNIAGSGKLKLAGTGTLELAGQNSYSGGTEVAGGTLKANSATAFGTGDVYLGAGAISLESKTPLAIKGQYTQLAGTALNLTADGNGVTPLTVDGQVTLGGGDLNITFAEGYAPQAGTTFTVISAGSRKGEFAAVTVAGYVTKVTYDANRITVTLIEKSAA